MDATRHGFARKLAPEMRNCDEMVKKASRATSDTGPAGDSCANERPFGGRLHVVHFVRMGDTRLLADRLSHGHSTLGPTETSVVIA